MRFRCVEVLDSYTGRGPMLGATDLDLDKGLGLFARMDEFAGMCNIIHRAVESRI